MAITLHLDILNVRKFMFLQIMDGISIRPLNAEAGDLMLLFV